MVGLLDIYAEQSDLSAREPLTAMPRTLAERTEATAAETFSPDRYFTSRGAQRDMWQRSVDELHKATGQTYQNPYGAVTSEEMMRLGNQPAIEAERRQRIIDATRMARANGNEDLFNAEEIDAYIGAESKRRRDTAHRLAGTGNGIGNFIVGMGLETATPHGLAGLLVPVTRMPSAAASVIGETFLRNVAREAAFQAGANMGIQAGAETLDYLSRRQFGTEQTAAELAANIATAGVAGALIGGGVRALHLKWLGLPEEVRASAPLEVKDAFRVLELDALYAARNRLGLPWELHERYSGRANDAVLRGMPVDLGHMAGAGESPMTALSTILRGAPDGAGGLRVQGLEREIGRLRSLPDTEIDALAREARPKTFATLDAVDAKLRALDERDAALTREAEQIGVPDIIDLDTAALINDAVENLKRTDLTRQQRIDYEHQRDTWLQSIDPHGVVARELEDTRKDFFPEHAAERVKIAEERVALMRERAGAESVARGEVDAFRKKLESMSFGRQFVDDVTPEVLARELETTPVDFADALMRADMARQMAIARDAGFFAARTDPEGRAPAPVSAVASSKPVEMTPEQAAALDNQAKQLLEQPDVADHKIVIEGNEMSARAAMEEVEQMRRDAAAAAACVVGVPI